MNLHQNQHFTDWYIMFTVPLVAIFTKFDGQTIKEYTDLSDMGSEITDKWDKAREKAEKAFETVYLPKVLDTKHPPKAYVLLEGRIPQEWSCIEITL